jgi:LmbE family N-acetylglucosaminyl deacetylase
MKNKQLRIMPIGAHPDDCELYTGGTCLKFSALGHKVKFVYTTNGDAGHHIHSGRILAAIRASEAANACATGGFEHEIMNNHDGYLEATIQNRDNLIRIIREFRPDIIFTHRLNDYHTDHRNTALLVQDTAYLLMVPNICPDSPALDYSPIIMYMVDSFKKPNEFEPTVVVDIDDVYGKKIRMADCHKSQMYEWLPWIEGYAGLVPEGSMERLDWLAEKTSREDGVVAGKYRSQLVARYGIEAGSKVKCAEAFELSEYGGRLTEEMTHDYFPF